MAQQNMDWQTALNMWLTIPVEDWVPEPVPVDSSVVEAEAKIASNQFYWEKYLVDKARIDAIERAGGAWWNDDFYIPDECSSECECVIYEEDDGPWCNYCVATINCRCDELDESSHGGSICVYCRTFEKFGLKYHH